MWRGCRGTPVKETKTYIHTYIYTVHEGALNNFEICICTSVFLVRYSDSEQFLVSAGADSQILGTSCILIYVCTFVCMYVFMCWFLDWSYCSCDVFAVMALLDNNSHCLMYVCMYVCGSLVDAFADNCETIARPQRRGLFSSDGRQVQRDHLRIAWSGGTLICLSIYIYLSSMYVCMYVCMYHSWWKSGIPLRAIQRKRSGIHTFIHTYIHT